MKKSNRKIVERGKIDTPIYIVGVITLVSVLYEPLFVILSFSFWSLYCLFFFDLQLVARVAQWVRSLDLTAHTSLSPVRRGFAPSFVNYSKGCNRLAVVSDKVYKLLAQGRWFSPGTLASSTTKTGRHAESCVKHQKSKINQINLQLLITTLEYSVYSYRVCGWNDTPIGF